MRRKNINEETYRFRQMYTMNRPRQIWPSNSQLQDKEKQADHNFDKVRSNYNIMMA